MELLLAAAPGQNPAYGRPVCTLVRRTAASDEGIYTLASVYGLGAGQALLDALVGDRPAYLWVAAINPRAQHFYRRNGFGLDGTTDAHPLAGIPVDIVRMVR